MASPMRKSGIPVKSTAAKPQGGGAAPTNLSIPRISSIPIKKTKNVDSSKSTSLGQSASFPAKERELQEIEKLKSEIKEKDSTINDLNEKLMERMNECQVLREENQAARENLNFSSDQEVSEKMKDLEKLLNQKETFIENMLTQKRELERKFEVELDMLKNQHEVEVLSFQQRLEDAHQKKLEELKTSLNKEKLVNSRLREELEGARGQNSSAEINVLHEELMSTKLRYENTIYGLKQELEKEKNERENLALKQQNERKEIENIKEKHTEDMETLKYLVQEKDILIHDLKATTNSKDEKSLDAKLYSDEDVTTRLEELRQELTIEHEQNIALANELWRKKFEEQKSADPERTKKDNDEHQGTQHQNTDNLQDEISDLKEQLHEANEVQEEQSELLEIRLKEIEELKESNKKFEERYTTLFKEMESKWQSEFSESEIIEKIKNHYEVEIERLHSDLEELQNENSNLKTEIDLMANDFDGGHSRIGAPTRRPSVTARIDMKAEMEDYKVQLASLERELQHALNQNERLKLENSARNGEKVDSKLEEFTTISNRVDELQQEREKLIAERDDFRVKFEESKKERKKLEKDLKIRDEERIKIEEELKAKNNEIALLIVEQDEDVNRSETKVLEMKANIDELTNKCEKADKELISMREAWEKSKNREGDLDQNVHDLKGKEANLTKEIEEANSKISTLEKQINKMNSEGDNARDESNKVKDSEERQQVDTKKRLTELENMLALGKVANEALKMKYDKLMSENEKKTSRICELEVAISQVKTNFENSTSSVNCEKGLSENDAEKDSIEDVESRLNQRNEEYESLTKKYEDIIRENESKRLRVGEIESLLRQKDVEYRTLSANCNELRKENQNGESRIASLEAAVNEQKSRYAEVESLNTDLQKENDAMTTKISELENLLKQSKDECAQWQRNYQNLYDENKSRNSGSKQLEASLNESEVEYQKLKENYQKVLEEINIKVSEVEKLEKERTQFRKQITAFEKRVVMQEREKKSLEEKLTSLDEVIAGQKKDISSLNEKCESYDWKNADLETKLEALRNTEETLKTYTERNQELLLVIEQATREKNELVAKQAELLKDNKQLRDERDTLKDEKGHYESEKDQDSSEHERKLETAQKKLKEKDRVLNETKKHCRQLKESEKQLKESINEKEEKCLELQGKIEELNKKLKQLSKENDPNETRRQNKDLEKSFDEKNKRCLELEEKLEHINREFSTENRKLKQLLEETKYDHNEKEQALQEEMARQKNSLARELKNVQEHMKQSAEIEISRLNQELQKKLGSNENEEMRTNIIRLGEENHTLKIKLDDLGIEISKEKEEKYKVEKLKDQFRFQVQSLQERLEAEEEKISVLQNQHLRKETTRHEERSKLLETLNEYESKNTMLISNIDKASSVLKTTKDKYAKLKERYTTLAKKYTKLNEEKLNKSDVQVGPDTSVDFSLIVEDLERSKQTAEETNFRLRVELDKLREEIGRSEYQVKAVRKANVVLMKQSRCLYHESEEQKRLEEERTNELQKCREMKESLQKEKESWMEERKALENKVKKFVEDTAMLKRENEEYFLAKNKAEIELGKKASECVLHSRQIERLKGENEFLYHQGRKLQAEVDVSRVKYTTPSTFAGKLDENRNFLPSFEQELGTIKDFGTRKLSKESKLSESTNNLSFDERRNFAPQVFNNEKIVADKVIENSMKNTDKSSPPSNKTYSGKDTNLQISRNIMTNEFATEKYLGKTYWDTLEFLKKK